MLEFAENFSGYPPVIWTRKLNPIYRILRKREQIEDFFVNGNIYLSCFNKFKLNKDEMQGDISEGQSLIGGFNKEGGTNHIFFETGMNAYVLCGTNVITPKVKNDFSGEGAIKIKNSEMFGIEIAKKLSNVTYGLEGDCIYGDSKLQLLKDESKENLLFQNIDFTNTQNIQEQVALLSRGLEMFMKYKKYEHQQEHRFLWLTDENIEDGIVLNCPEAIKYCEEIIF
ncbi:hypothetical protein SAMN05421789_11729 [Kaistella chaponensis]|uniref:Uncharacterized protein n=1 Tax=Kaistella chaponensis TaxID=713588 RepID=A0A1N7NTV6_9FLAO|nr:hypothetical protein [Kaistella chaponensis]SIT01718.1 hypothetical protein SAMN05421789_11729 [Kaistella chaponensis]